MRFLNKYFFIGLATGVLLMIAVLVVGGLIFVRMVSERIHEDVEEVAATLPAPKFPDRSSLSAYGQADYDWSIRALDGKEIRLSDFKGKVVFLNLWATWCAPCIAEMPSIQRLYDSMKNEEVVFLLVSDEEEETVRDFMKKNQYTFPVYLRDKDIPSVFKTRAIPTTYILDREGTIVFKHIGPANWADESCRSFIRGLM